MELLCDCVDLQNEETLKNRVAGDQMKLKKQDERYNALKRHAEEKLTLLVFTLTQLLLHML